MLKYDNEPFTHWHIDEFNNFLIWAVDNDVSDVQMIPNLPVCVRHHGNWIFVTSRGVSSDEIMSLIDQVSNNPVASANLRGGYDVDFAHEIRIDRFKVLRFRGNATACSDGWSIGASVVLRVIPSIPPKLEDLGVEKEITDNAFPNNGLVLVTGVMGTGKSTLLASMLRMARETQPKNIITYESPIEFNLMDIPNAVAPLTQSSIPEHLQSFKIAPRNAARRAADIILVGESRDPETLLSMIEAAEIGVCAYSTVHTRSVAETPSRIINVFPHERQRQVATTLISCLRLIIQQRLVPRVGGGRIALREYLVLTSDHRKYLQTVDITNLIKSFDELVSKDGQKLVHDAYQKLQSGLIEAETYETIAFEQGEASSNVA